MEKNFRDEKFKKELRRRRAIRTVIVIAIILSIGIIASWLSFGTASAQRMRKSLKSDVTGGLNRTLSVYSYDGNLIDSFTGKFDVERSDEGLMFDLNGKRVTINGGIIINIEN